MENMKKYNICGLNALCDFRYPTMIKRCAKYLCDFEGEADITIIHSEKMLNRYKEEYPQFSLNDCEVMVSSIVFYKQLLLHNGFMLHSSAVAMDGKAYLFSAPSGTGKSTHTRLWIENFPNKAYILNDDKPAICNINGKFYACGTPWSGKSDLNENKILPLQGICVLSQSQNNHIELVNPSDGIFHILNQTLRPVDLGQMNNLLDLIEEVLKEVKIWYMGCNISLEAAQMAYDAMK